MTSHIDGITPVDLLPWIARLVGEHLLGLDPHHVYLKVVPTTNLDTTFGLSLSVFALLVFYNVKVKGMAGYGKQFLTHPFGPVLAPVNVVMTTVEEVKGEGVLLGARPCDIMAISIVEKVFAGKEYTDVYFLVKRKKTTIIGLGCNHPLSTCFCSSTGGGPFLRAGSDLFFIDLGEAYFVELLTEKGMAFQKNPFLKEAEQVRAKLRAGTSPRQKAMARGPTRLSCACTTSGIGSGSPCGASSRASSRR